MTKDHHDLTGRTALVTGGGGGLGRAIALCLAESGADVAVLDIVPERGHEVVARVEELGRRCIGIAADVMETSAIEDAVARTADHFGGLDILINNAGGVRQAPFADLTERQWRRHIDLNLISTLAATSAAYPHLAKSGQGAIVNVTSIEGARACPGSAVYAACKAGVDNLTRTLAVEFSDVGIRVNAVAPDYFVTPGLRGNLKGPVDEAAWLRPPPSHDEQVRRRIPLGRTGIDRECGRLAAFLVSDAASYISGAIVPIDGGTWASGGWIRGKSGGWILPPDAEA